MICKLHPDGGWPCKGCHEAWKVGSVEQTKMIMCLGGCGDTFPESHFHSEIVETETGNFREKYTCITCGGAGEEEPSNCDDTGLEMQQLKKEYKELLSELESIKNELSNKLDEFGERWNFYMNLDDYLSF